ncbi:ABC transporter permease [Calditrichota bacterium]
MFKNYLKISIRNLHKHKSFTLINILGLALGMMCCIIITKFIISEVGYDSYHFNGDRLYRVSIESEVLKSGESWKGALSPILWGPALAREYPGIENYTRLMKSWEPLTFEINDQRVQQDNIYFAENSLFDLFNWDLTSGNPSTIFNNPNSIVLTDRLANTYFGNENPIGKTIVLVLTDRDEQGHMVESKIQMTVTGVMADVYPKTHMKPELLVSFTTLNDFYGGDVNTGNHPDPNFWRRTNTYTYLLLREGNHPKDIEEKFTAFMDKYIGDANVSRGFQYHPYLQNVSEIHLEKDIYSTPEPGGDKDYIYLFSIISLFILLIACFNFVNLTTARAGNRYKEVGIRKVVGSKRRDLIIQFLSESILISITACALAFVLSEIINPLFSYYIGKDVSVLPQEIPLFIFGIIGISLLAGICAGSYPAFIMSSFKPVLALKNTFKSGRKGIIVRRTLVIMQFVITVVFIIATITVKNQIEFMQTNDLGFDSSHILVLPANQNSPLSSQMDGFRNEALQNQNVKSISLSSEVPGTLYREDLWKEYQTDNDITALYEIETDYDFIDVYNLSLIAGRRFSKEMSTDAGSYLSKETNIFSSAGIPITNEGGSFEQTEPKEIAVILNEEAVQRMGFSSPEQALGKVLVRDPVSVDFLGRIIGVVNDFHFASLQYGIEPLVIYLHDKSDSYPLNVSVHISGNNMAETISFIEQLWKSHFPKSSFNYLFIDDNFAQLYEKQERTLEIFGYLTLLAILIACLGLFGLTLYIAFQKTKEIGIRKVLGASVFGIVKLLSKDLLFLVVIAFIIAGPVAWFTMNKWLQNFAYRIEISWWVFLLAGVIALIISMFAVCSQAIKAALNNPVNSLRYE